MTIYTQAKSLGSWESNYLHNTNPLMRNKRLYLGTQGHMFFLLVVKKPLLKRTVISDGW